jgi:protocatechuate 3,4-dioxygenase beta subunit
MSETESSRRDWRQHPPCNAPGYKSTGLRAPAQPFIQVPDGLRNVPGPSFRHLTVGELDADLTRNAARGGEPLGERIIVTGQIRDDRGRPVPATLVELWQANAAGRYNHAVDQHDAPLDPNFLGAGRCLTDAQGRYRFVTVKPGAYPWGNHANAWRPNHLHFSVFGAGYSSRLVTQMYFPGDPLLDLDPIFLSTPAAARHLLISEFSLDVTEEGFALGYVFDMVLSGANATPFED